MFFNNFRRASSAIRARQAHYCRVHRAPANELPAPVEEAIPREDRRMPEEQPHEDLVYPAGSFLETKVSSAKTTLPEGEEDIFDFTPEQVDVRTLEALVTKQWSLLKLAYRAEGGYGRLYEAANLADGRFAIKGQSAPATGKSTRTWTSEVKRELFYLVNYPHAHIVKYLDCFWACTGFSAIPRHLFIRTELLEVDLWDAMTHNYGSPFDGFIVFRLAGQITSALAFLHQRCVVHHDIKPQNIMMADQSWTESPDSTLYSATWKLIDMGLCRRYADQQADEPSYRRGTDVFFSPEKKSCPLRPYSPYLADSYAWGLTLLCALTGKSYLTNYMWVNNLKYETLDLGEMAEEYFRSRNQPLQPMEEIVKQMLGAEDERLSMGELHQRLQSME